MKPPSATALGQRSHSLRVVAARSSISTTKNVSRENTASFMFQLTSTCAICERCPLAKSVRVSCHHPLVLVIFLVALSVERSRG
ncbi:uncharacterized protein BDV17DRAFT_249770 [Aspergillus undulatus]|uniref:uncharacterized protein n=1 Tax=Aspergillus undulatus TaxID=1810928 RepID=UPI003CCCF3FE